MTMPIDKPYEVCFASDCYVVEAPGPFDALEMATRLHEQTHPLVEPEHLDTEVYVIRLLAKGRAVMRSKIL